MASGDYGNRKSGKATIEGELVKVKEHMPKIEGFNGRKTTRNGKMMNATIVVTKSIMQNFVDSY